VCETTNKVAVTGKEPLEEVKTAKKSPSTKIQMTEECVKGEKSGNGGPRAWSIIARRS